MFDRNAFSQTYAEARDKFLAASGGQARRRACIAVGATATAWTSRARRYTAVLIIKAPPRQATRIGRAITLLGDAGFRAAREAGVALLYIHALNPTAFVWRRDARKRRPEPQLLKPLPTNPGYDNSLPARAAHLARLRTRCRPASGLRRAARHSGAAASLLGRPARASGLFYGGVNPLGNATLRQVRATNCAKRRRAGSTTGLGPSGHGERIFACRDEAAALARARDWWGDAVTSIYDGSSTSALLTGLMWLSAYEECPQAEYTGIALEYGTVPLMEVFDALRADQWLENHPEAAQEQRSAIKRRLRDAFYTDTDAWKSRSRAGAAGLRSLHAGGN
jgi:hypothetical protein